MVRFLMEGKKGFSIKKIITIVFIIAMLITVSGIGVLIISRWISSAEESTKLLSEDIIDGITGQVDEFIHTPEHINEVNHKIIQNEILDLKEQEQRDRYFVGVLSAQHKEIYSFSYGTATGEYYGARRNRDGNVEIMRNNAETGGQSWYYEVEADLTAGDLKVQAGPFDPRTRAWYKAAEERKGPAYSPVYKHFIMDDLAISASWPIFDNNEKLLGVMGTHMLLSDFGGFLGKSVDKYDGYAFIIEKQTGALIANSMGLDNFQILQDGSLVRKSPDQIENEDIQKAYLNYKQNSGPAFVHNSKEGDLFVNTREISREGIEWIVVTAIPEGLYMEKIEQSIQLTIIFIVLAVLLSLAVYKWIMSKLLKPMQELLQVSASLSEGDLSVRVNPVRNDEIGEISFSLNKVADKMQFLINNLEENVRERSEELRLILDSTAEAIYGIDTNGKCTFCNRSCLELLGYEKQEDLLGKDMHEQIHHTKRDGTPFRIEDCKISCSIKQGKGFEASDEVFWRADNTSFDVEYHAYPQIKDGVVVGGVITFMDITDRKKKEDEIKFLSCHDTLTGLNNRRCFEENYVKIDTSANLPISLIFADINGLKMTNDIFGHSAGDKLIKKSAEILQGACREQDEIARIGGDEFVIILPKTGKEEAQRIVNMIREGFADARIEAIKCSISLGCDTKTVISQPLEEVMTNAENEMYKDKTLNRQTINKDIIDTIVETLHGKSPREEEHSIRVSELCGIMAAALGLSEAKIDKSKRAGYLHDIGKITLYEDLLHKELLTEQDINEMRQHSVVGYRILNLFDDTLDLAEYVYGHHERWDGKGYPRGLKGEQIPLIARIIAIAETYDRVAGRDGIPKQDRKRTALDAIREGAGTQFDPEKAEVFIRIMEQENQTGGRTDGL